eukprot:TRINITY_DN927_c1_g1_i2.p1 TRINITY_DN927_c1_g1~~TRINITY_DN927_c1_g1_i2.p1  ORF type:complete len:1169 (+),score=295.10 TRINITY_DN927_c1_g1_i2:54-3509(+)
MRSSDMSWLLLMSSLCTVSTAQFTWVPVAGTSCLDGSTAGYYKSAGSAASSMWVVGAGGGEPCGFPAAKGEDCRDQTRGIAGSSKSFPATVASEQQLPNYNPYEVLVMSNVEALNERFHQANKVWIPHCSGDMHIGRLTKPTPVSHGMKFSGATNMELILQALNATTELGTGDDLLFTGSGVGGYAVLQHCDYAAGVFSGSSVACVPVDGFIFPSLDLTNMSVFWAPPSDYASFVTAGQDPDPSRFFSLLVLWQAKVHAGCAGALAAQGPLGGACLSMATVMATDPNAFADARVRLFIVQNRYDGLQLTLNGLTGNVSAGTNYINYYGERMAATLQSPNVSSHGLFLTSCYSHIAGVSAAAGAGVPAAMPLFTVDGVNAAKAVADWYFNVASSVSHRHIHSCTTVSCDSTCVIPIPEGETIPPVPSPQLEYLSGVGYPDEGPRNSEAWVPSIVGASILAVVCIGITVYMCIRGSKPSAALFFIGLLFIVLGLVAWGAIPAIIQENVRKGSVFDAKDEEQVRKFENTKRDDASVRYREFYAFNITNINAVLAGTEKPHVNAVGPFVYRYYSQAMNVTEVNDTMIRYIDYGDYDFIPESSPHPEDTILYVLNMPYTLLVSRLAISLKGSGEGEIQMGAPSLLFDKVAAGFGGLNAAGAAWATMNVEAQVAGALGVPRLPFVFGFAAYTSTVSKSNNTITQAEGAKIFSILSFGTTGAGAKNLITLVGALEATSECLAAQPSPCAHLNALLGILARIGGTDRNPSVFANPALVPDFTGYFHQLIYDGRLGPQSLGVLSALTMGKDGWVHRTFTKREAKGIWFSNDDPLHNLLQGKPFPGVFSNYNSQEEAAPHVMGEWTTQSNGKGDWRDSYFVYEEDGLKDVPYWREPLKCDRSYARIVPQPDYSYSGIPSTPEKAAIWVDLLWRPVGFRRIATETTKGVDMVRYNLDKSLLDVDGNFFNGNKGFINMTSVNGGFPVVYSGPHFSYAFDSEFSQKVDGLKPLGEPTFTENTDHATAVWVEPVTGWITRLARRLQLNVEIGAKNGVYFPMSYPTLDTLKTDPKGIIFPVFYVDEHGQLSDDQADTIKMWVHGPLKARSILCVILWVVGALMIGLSFFLFYRAVTRPVPEEDVESKNHPEIEAEEAKAEPETQPY